MTRLHQHWQMILIAFFPAWKAGKHWHNRAAQYGLPQDKRQEEATWDLHTLRGERESIYYRDNSPFDEVVINDFVSENERLNRCWKPQYHSSG